MNGLPPFSYRFPDHPIFIGFSIIDHPAIGLPPFTENPLDSLQSNMASWKIPQSHWCPASHVWLPRRGPGRVVCRADFAGQRKRTSPKSLVGEVGLLWCEMKSHHHLDWWVPFLWSVLLWWSHLFVSPIILCIYIYVYTLCMYIWYIFLLVLSSYIFLLVLSSYIHIICTVSMAQRIAK